jgi:hypothetical protein
MVMATEATVEAAAAREHVTAVARRLDKNERPEISASTAALGIEKRKHEIQPYG